MRIERFSQALLRPDARALERAFSRAMITEGGKTGTASANITLELLDSEGQLVAPPYSGYLRERIMVPLSSTELFPQARNRRHHAPHRLGPNWCHRFKVFSQRVC